MAAPPVLLVHGFASSFERNWRGPGWVDLLQEEGYEVIGLDLLGHGDAPKPTEPAAYRDLERSVAAAVPEDRPVDAIGFSLGAELLLRAASSNPHLFNRIVVGGVGENLLSAGEPEAVARAVESGDVIEEGGHPASAALVRFAAAADNDRAALAACLRRPHAPMREDDLQAIDLPVLVVLGDRDFAGPADRLLAALPRPAFVGLAGADHFATPRDFRFIDAALSFLRAP